MNPRSHWLVCAICLFFVAQVLAARAADRVPIIGIPTIAAGPFESIIQEFRTGLRSFGYVDGQNVRVEVRTAQGRLDQLPALAEELVKLNVDVIVTGASVARAFTQISSATPIVIVVHEADPTALRIIEDFGHPGGNLTGIYARESELVGKRLELLKEALPGVTRIAVFWEPFSKFQRDDLQTASQSLGLRLDPVEIDSTYDFAAAFKRAQQLRTHAVMVLLSPSLYVRRNLLADAALRARLPTMFQNDVMVQAGGLMSYGTSFADTWGRAAYFVDRILKGAKPSDLPVEQVSKFTFAINLKTARALGVKISDSVLLRADEVIR